MLVRCWAVRDTGLHAAPGPFRALAGSVRHHRRDGDAWPDPLELAVDLDAACGGRVRVDGVGTWPIEQVAVELVAPGPPVTFVLRVPGATRLLATAAGPEADALLAALS